MPSDSETTVTAAALMRTRPSQRKIDSAASNGFLIMDSEAARQQAPASAARNKRALASEPPWSRMSEVASWFQSLSANAVSAANPPLVVPLVPVGSNSTKLDGLSEKTTVPIGTRRMPSLPARVAASGAATKYRPRSPGSTHNLPTLQCFKDCAPEIALEGSNLLFLGWKASWMARSRLAWICFLRGCKASRTEERTEERLDGSQRESATPVAVQAEPSPCCHGSNLSFSNELTSSVSQADAIALIDSRLVL
mmetsp:Transcript_10791/g.23805  ORF Transcript_10791/g.23805 Transcript_10791/m.23805 type:complete len:252 (-) Transcript_10791:24-779(-)